MHVSPLRGLSALLVFVTAVASSSVRPFQVDLSDGVARMSDLVRQTRLPPPPPTTPSSPTTLGIDLKWLASLQETWLNDFDWDKQQRYINSFDHYKTELEGLDIHFVHARARAPSGTPVIPLILTHGWPGSFLEFLPVIDKLTRGRKGIAFDVVIPSLPGFAFSSPPPPVWTANDTARVWNALMVDVLGYTNGYSVAGTDWGGMVNWCLLNDYPLAKSAHFNFLAIVPPSVEHMTAAGAQLNDFERSGLEYAQAFFQTGAAYFHVHQTRPLTLGLALSDNPMGQLAWIAEKYHDWSDPALVNPQQILTTVSLYYLSGSFPTSLFIYAQNSGFAASDVRGHTRKPFGYGAFRWEGIRHPEAFVKALGNLVYYKEHAAGGHFAPSEVPDAYAADLMASFGESYHNTTSTSRITIHDAQTRFQASHA